MLRRRLVVALVALAGAWAPASVRAGADGGTKATDAGASPALADLPAILAAARAPGARAVLINVWATWCDPCREELPDLIRFYRDHRADGLRLILVSADDPQDRAEVTRLLAAAGAPPDTPSFIKTGDDMKFIDGLDRRWSGAIPASFLYDGRGRKRRWWAGPVTARDLDGAVAGLLPARPPEAPPERRPK